MKTGYLKRMAGILVVIFAFCSMAEAGASASKAYRLSVRVPARAYFPVAAELSVNTKKQDLQVAMEKELRGGQVVMVQTAVVK